MSFEDVCIRLKEYLVNYFLPKNAIVDNITTDDSTRVLSAKQGKELYSLIENASDVNCIDLALRQILNFGVEGADEFNIAIVNKENENNLWILANAIYDSDLERFIKIKPDSTSFGVQIQSESDSPSIHFWRNPPKSDVIKDTTQYDYTDFDEENYIGARRLSSFEWVETGIDSGWNNCLGINEDGEIILSDSDVSQNELNTTFAEEILALQGSIGIDLGNYYTKNEVDSVIRGIVQFDYEVVQTLPQSGSKGVIYLILKEDTEIQDVYDEYLYIINRWEKIGTTQIDFTQYYNKTEVDNSLSLKQDSLIAGSNISIVDDVISATSQVQSDYAQTDDSEVDFIKNKPVWKRVYDGSGLRIWEKDDLLCVRVHLTVTYSTMGGNVNIGTIPSEYTPPIHMRMKGHTENNIFITIESNGTVKSQNYSGTGSSTVNALFLYPKSLP